MRNLIFFKELVNHSLSLECVTDLDINHVYSNHAFNELFRYTQKQLASKPLNLLMFPENGREMANVMRQTAISKGVSGSIIVPVISSSGEQVEIYMRCASILEGKYLLWSGANLHTLAKTGHELLGKLKDAHHSVSTLKEQEFKLNFALECAMSVCWEMTSDLKRVVFGENFERILGIRQSDYNYDFTEFLNTHLAPYKDAVLASINDYIAGKTAMVQCEVSIRDTRGDTHWLIVRGKYLNGDKKLIYGVSVDITEQKLFERRLADLAYRDTLTGLYKMEYLLDAIAGRVESLKLSNMGIIIMDIWRFRRMNAVFGRECSDNVLIYTAEKLTALAGEHLLMRVAGDEFMIVFNNASGVEVLENTAKAILGEFDEPVEIDGQLFYIGLNIGIAMSREGSSDFESLRKDAEVALSHVKQDSSNNICVINDRIRKNMDDLINTGFELRSAIDQRSFSLLFQPIVSLKTRKAAGAEALVRWNHPTRGTINPMLFIPVAEETGLIHQIGDFVMEEALWRLSKWLELDSEFFVSVNISVIQFMSPTLTDRILELIQMYSIPRMRLTVEVTESLFISDLPQVIAVLRRLRLSGIKVSLDDFGTGYSSLSHLRTIPLDNLKIDRSFITDASDNPVSEAILKSIIGLGQNLSLSLTAEGVETERQLNMLEKYDCDFIQGYYFSRPVPPEQIDKFILSGIEPQTVTP